MNISHQPDQWTPSPGDVQTVAAAGRVLVGKVANKITEVAEARDAGLIDLATHVKAGTRTFWANSIAAQVQGETARPLLLVPV